MTVDELLAKVYNVFIILLFSGLAIGVPAISGENVAGNSRTFVDVIGKKIILELYNAPDGFLATLLAEDTLGLIERDLEIQSSSQPDSFVIYLENWGELDRFSESMRRAFNSVPYTPETTYFLFRITPPGGPIRQMHFINLAAYGEMSEAAVLCRSVRSIYKDMQYYSSDNGAGEYVVHTGLFRGCPKD